MLISQQHEILLSLRLQCGFTAINYLYKRLIIKRSRFSLRAPNVHVSSAAEKSQTLCTISSCLCDKNYSYLQLL